MSSEQLRNELEEKRRRIEQIKMARLQQQQNSTLVANSSMSCASPSGIHRSPSFADSSGATNFSHAPILTSALSNLSRSSSFVSYANPQAAASPTNAGLGAHPATKYPSLSGSVTSPRRAPLTGAGSMSSPTARTSDYTPSFPSSSGVTNVTMPTISSNVTQVNPTASTTRPAWTPGGANTTTAPTRPPTLHNPQLSMTTYLTVADVHAKAPPERYEKEIQVEEAVISLHTGITSDTNAVSTGGGFLLAPTSAMEDSRSSSVPGPSVSVPDTPDLERVPSIMDDEAKARAAFLAEQQSQQRREQLLSRPDLDSFLSKSSLVMERALVLNRDMFLERAAGIYDGDIVRHRGLGALQRTSHCFEDEATHNCAVTALSFQPSSSVEFFCASYRDLTKGFNATDEGFILGWSLHVRKPAFRLSTPSELSNMQYCEYRPHLIIGGTYSGQVILWDTRKGTSPVVVTAVMKENHTNPIFGINLVGTMSNHQLITTSNDGRMCTWNLDKMTAPVERTNLQVKEEVGDTAINKSITCTSVDFSHQDSEKFFVGGENGVMYSASRHSTQSYLNKVEGHTSPITSISCHPMNSSTGEDAEMGNLVLSSSLDWTVNLWYEDRSTLTLVGSFTDYLDYVYDVQWSPVNPSMFATGDGNGAVTLWNLARSWASPAGRYFINNDESQHLGTQSAHAHHQGTTHAVNRISWSPDGAFLAVGDSSGSISLLTVMDHMPMDDDAQKLRTNVMSAHRAATRK